MPLNKKKLKLLMEFKRNPTLALIKFAKQIELQVNSWIKEALNEGLEAIESRIDTIISQKIEKKAKESVFKGIEKIKGEKGDTGEEGNTPVKGKDYFTEEEINNFVEEIQSLIKVPKDGMNGKDGIIPIAGKDYPSKQQIKNQIRYFISQIKIQKPKDGRDGVDGKDGSPDTPTDIKEKLLTFKRAWLPLKAIIGIDKIMKFGGGRTLHRGGIDFADSSLLGTGDGSTVAFTLPHTPYNSNSLKYMFVGGGVLFETDDWTRSTKVITFTTAPPTGAKVRNPMYRKS